MEAPNQFVLPVGLTSLLEEFVVKCIQQNPDDLIDFAADYFTMLKALRKKQNQNSPASPSKEDKDKKKVVEEDLPSIEPPKMQVRGRRRAVAAEAYNPAEGDANAKPIVHPKSKEQLSRLKKAVENILIFKSCDSEQLHEILDAMFEKKTTESEEIIRQGDDGDNFYVIDSGLYDVFINMNGKETKVHTFKDEGSFGELALMYNCPRNATIRACSEGGILWALDQATFRRIVVGAAARKRKVYESLLESVPVLKELQEYERMNLADALQSFTFEKGECVIKEGAAADCMYFIEQGEVRVMVSDGKEEKEISKLGKGAYFGELALVMNQARSASVYAASETTKCAKLKVDAFERLLGPCMDIMKRNIGHYEEQRKKLGLDSGK